MSVNNKPTGKPEWIPDDTTNITDPGAKATNGWLSGDAAPSEAFNWFWNLASQWIDYQDEHDYFTNNYTISVANSSELQAAITEIAGLPRNLNGYTLTISLTGTSYTITSILAFDKFVNGTVFLQATGGAATITHATDRVLRVDNCDNFRIGISGVTDAITLSGYDATTFPSSGASYFSNIKNLAIDDVDFENSHVTVGDIAVTIVDCPVVNFTGITTTGNPVFYNSRAYISGTVTLSGWLYAYKNSKVTIDQKPVDTRYRAGTGGEVVTNCNYITMLSIKIASGATYSEPITDLAPGETLQVYSVSKGTQQAIIKVVNVVGSRIYFYSTSGDTTPDGDWVELYSSTGAFYVGDLDVSKTGEGYAVIREDLS